MNGRFAVLTFNQWFQLRGYILEFTTDTPCHLWLYYTFTRPAKHLHPIMRRGWQMHCNPRFCFVGWDTWEQHEEGDTLLHSFNFFPLRIGNNIWFVLKGTINEIDVPSTSAIMHLPLEKQVYGQFFQLTGSNLMARKVTYNNPHAQNFWQLDVLLHFGFEFKTYTTQQPKAFTVSLWEGDYSDGKPATRLRDCPVYKLPDKVAPLPIERFFVPLPEYRLTPKTRYAIVIEGDPDYPDTETLLWSIRFQWHPPLPRKAWIGTRTNGVITWAYSESWWHDIHMYAGMPFYQPGPPTAEQLWG